MKKNHSFSVTTECRNGKVLDLTRFSSKAMKIFGRFHAWVDEIKGDRGEIVSVITATFLCKTKNNEQLFKIQIADNFSNKF